MTIPKLTAISGGESNCAGGQCPTVYRSEDGRVFVQGWKVADAIRQSVLPTADEDMVEVPAALLTSVKL